MEQANLIMVAILIALGVVLVAGLVVIPEIEQQQLALADKGGIPHTGSNGRGRNHT